MPSVPGHHIAICSHLLRCGGVFLRASVGFRPLLAPLLLSLVGWFVAVLIWAVLSLPSFVLGLVFRFLSCVAPCWWCFRCVGVSACAFAGVFPWPSCAFLWVVGSLCACPLFGCCRLPPLPVVASLPPAVGPLWRPGPVSTLVPPSGYLVAFCDGLVALPYCWGCGCALSSSLHFVSWQQRPLALCGVCFTLYTMMHVLFGCSVLPR